MNTLKVLAQNLSGQGANNNKNFLIQVVLVAQGGKGSICTSALFDILALHIGAGDYSTDFCDNWPPTGTKLEKRKSKQGR